MKNVCFAILLLSVGFIGITSCGGDDAVVATTCSIAWGNELQSEITALVNAATAYSDDDSEVNCNAYKAAQQAYIDALRPYGNCSALTGQNRTIFDETLDDLETSVDNIC